MNKLYNKDNVSLLEFLEKNYPNILNSIKKENYTLEFMEFRVFHEIYCEDEVVGFISLDQFHIIPTDISINECYVMPEFRGKNLLYNELFNLITSPNFTFYPRNPNRAFVNVLLKNNLAFKFSNNLVISYMKFILDLNTVYKNSNIKRFYKNPDLDEIPYKANIFDMDLCSIFFLDPMLNFIKYSDVMALTLPRKSDLKKYKLRKKLKRVSEGYLDKCYDAREKADEEILDYFDEVENDIYDLICVENTLGTSDELKTEFAKYLKENKLSDDDGFKIIENITGALEKNELTIKNCRRRMHYLVENIDMIDGALVDDDDGCPFCGEYNFEFVDSCETCGQRLRDISYEEELKHNFDDFDIEKLLEDFDHEKFQEMLDLDEFWGRVPIEENDPYFDLKTFYNEKLTFFDFEEIKQYYDNADKSLSLDTIFEEYFDDKIANCRDKDDKFDLYKDFLLNYFYYNLETNKFSVALTYLIQFIILASNEDSIFEGDIIQRTPYSTDALFAIEEFLKHAEDYDVDKCLDEAFKTFKVDEWNSNKEEIYEIIPQYF
ncbi:MAG: hypothetical protein IJF83_11920 [Methanobrevibacter sp.]|nr:hypothetical protein [Methanobrevibacter sp.]